MFTRCPDCETTFRLSATDLRRAQGKVRCGECDTVFNALEYLAEDDEVEQETGQDWPIKPANDSLADTVIDTAPDFAAGKSGWPSVDDASKAGDADDTISGQTADDADWDAGADDDEEPSADADDDSGGILVSESDLELTAAGDDGDDGFEIDVSLFAGSETDTESEEIEGFSTSYPKQDSDSGHEPYTGALDRSHEPQFGEMAADEDESDLDDEPVLFVDSDDEDDEIDGPIVFEPDDGDVTDDSDETADTGPTAEPVAIEDEEEFDDSIWERIPGVGSAFSDTDDRDEPHGHSLGQSHADSHSDSNDDLYISESERSYKHGSGNDEDDWLTEEDSASTVADDAEDALTEDETADDEVAEDSADSNDSLEFDAPRDKWSSIFASTASWQQEEEDDPVSFTDSADGWHDSADDDDDDEDEDEDEDDGQRNSGRDYYLAERDSSTDSNVDEDEDIWEVSAADEQEDDQSYSAWASAIEQTPAPDSAIDEPLSEQDAEGPELDPDEPPAEGYDVQHIVLADESEPAAESEPQQSRSWRPEPYTGQPDRPARTGLWLTGGLVMIVLLGAQLVHYNRDALATNEAWGGTVRDVYTQLGMELYPEWPIGDYEIRGSEAVAGESGPDVMDIRARIAAVGDAPVGLPYLRVILRDRWSNPVAARHFSPTEYAAADALPADLLMEPNSTVDAHVSIADPGSGAQGFELELCLPRRHTGMDCSGKPFR